MTLNGKNGTEVILNLSSNLIWNTNDEFFFSHKSLLNDTQVSRLCKAFANGSSANIEFWKTQLSKMIQLGGWLANKSGEAIEKKIRSSNNSNKQWYIRYYESN